MRAYQAVVLSSEESSQGAGGRAQDQKGFMEVHTE